jgi:hypothetical protein
VKEEDDAIAEECDSSADDTADLYTSEYVIGDVAVDTVCRGPMTGTAVVAGGNTSCLPGDAVSTAAVAEAVAAATAAEAAEMLAGSALLTAGDASDEASGVRGGSPREGVLVVDVRPVVLCATGNDVVWTTAVVAAPAPGALSSEAQLRKLTLSGDPAPSAARDSLPSSPLRETSSTSQH